MTVTSRTQVVIVGAGAGSVIQFLGREAAFATRLRMDGVDDVDRTLRIATVDVAVGGTADLRKSRDVGGEDRGKYAGDGLFGWPLGASHLKSRSRPRAA